MPSRNPYRALAVDVPRTGNNPEQIARAILPPRARTAALGVFGDRFRLVSVGSALQSLGDNWFMVIEDRTVFYAFGPQCGVSRPEFDDINVAARTSTIPVPWSDQKAEVAALGDTLPKQFWTMFR